MKNQLIILIVICCPLFVLGQDVEIAGKAKIETMDSDNTANSVVVRQADGTLAIRDASTIPNLLITVYDTLYQVLSISNDTIFLSNGGFVILPSDDVDDADSDPLNEKITSLMIMGDSLAITEGVMTMKVAVDSSNINELQTISRAGGSLTVNLSDGGGSYTDSIRSEMDIDGFVAGDIRDSINVVRQELSDTTEVLRGLIAVNTDKTGALMDSITAHREVLDGHWDSIEVHREALDVLFDADTSSTNELQQIMASLIGDTLYLSDGGFLIIPGLSAANFTVQEMLDAGVTPTEIIDSGIPVDSLYGKTYAGGLIFYVDVNDDHPFEGLVAAPPGWNGATDPLAEWGCIGSTITGADGTAIGTGAQNTLDIEVGCMTTGTAADLCANYDDGTYSDWFLPSKNELYEMYKNLQRYQCTAAPPGGSDFSPCTTSLGGFSTNVYWSSSEFNSNFAWHQDFFIGFQGFNVKVNDGLNVRSVRAF